MKRVVMGLVVILALGLAVAPSHAFLFGNCCCTCQTSCCAVAPYEVKVSYTPIQPQPGECTYCTCLPYGCPDGAPICPPCGPMAGGCAPCGSPCGMAAPCGSGCGILAAPCGCVVPIISGACGLVGGVLDCACGIVSGVLGCLGCAPCGMGMGCGPCGGGGMMPVAQ
ncbi:MAG: hypothetical protein KJ050_13410 [Candidatus Omnitrophica bacterium]|nr:hypothetical protein [Candidatus Omnitrophota bacterium]